MTVPVLKLNLAPPPTFWRQQHGVVGWAALGLGAAVLLASVGLSWHAYNQAERIGQQAVNLSKQAQEARSKQAAIVQKLQAVDVQKEAPRWKLAERILSERSNPWSRVAAELERALVQDVRIKNVQRVRSNDGKVTVKLKGEARTKEAEGRFVESLAAKGFFEQGILERESERQGGGYEFELALPVTQPPPPYLPLPKFGPTKGGAPAAASKPTSSPKAAQPKIAPSKSAPSQASAPAPSKPRVVPPVQRRQTAQSEGGSARPEGRPEASGRGLVTGSRGERGPERGPMGRPTESRPRPEGRP